MPLLSRCTTGGSASRSTAPSTFPPTGGALLVANHAGGLWALDAAMTAVAVHRAHRRRGQPAGSCGCSPPTWCSARPGSARSPRKAGATLACNPRRRAAAARRRAGRRVAGGLQGHRQAVQRALHSCSASAAAASCTPRCGPAPRSSRCRSSAPRRSTRCSATPRRWPGCSNLPYFPLTPTFPWLGPLGLVPLPSKWYIEFGEPIDTAPLRRGGRRRPGRAVRPHRPGARHDPEHAVPAARATPLGLALTPALSSVGGVTQTGDGVRAARRSGGRCASGPRRGGDRRRPRRRRSAEPTAAGRRSWRPCGRCGSRGSPSRAPSPRPAARSRG